MNDPKPTPKEISLTDPAASWTAAAGGFPVFAYSTNVNQRRKVSTWLSRLIRF
jgi:hypothetical protein